MKTKLCSHVGLFLFRICLFVFVILYLARLQFQLQIDKSEELENLQDVKGRLCTFNVLQVKFQLP